MSKKELNTNIKVVNNLDYVIEIINKRINYWERIAVECRNDKYENMCCHQVIEELMELKGRFE